MANLGFRSISWPRSITGSNPYSPAINPASSAPNTWSWLVCSNPISASCWVNFSTRILSTAARFSTLMNCGKKMGISSFLGVLFAAFFAFLASLAERVLSSRIADSLSSKRLPRARSFDFAAWRLLYAGSTSFTRIGTAGSLSRAANSGSAALRVSRLSSKRPG